MAYVMQDPEGYVPPRYNDDFFKSGKIIQPDLCQICGAPVVAVQGKLVCPSCQSLMSNCCGD